MNHEELFTVIWTKYQPLLKSLANRYCIRGHYEEYLAEAGIALYEAFLQFDPQKGHFAPYARRYVMGKLLNYLRKELRYREQHYFPSQSDEEEGSWEERLIGSEPTHPYYLSEESKTALTQLSPRERQAMIHCYVYDRSLEELARAEGVSHSTVSTWKRRGVAKLASILTPLG